jgi:acyl carrier protein
MENQYFWHSNSSLIEFGMVSNLNYAFDSIEFVTILMGLEPYIDIRSVKLYP